MAVYKCKMCGGTIEVTEGQKVVTCEFCGTTQTVHSFDNEKKTTFFKRAEALRFKCEFDKAAGVYETIVSEFPHEAEAYWGLVLCKYGIEYVDDPKTGKKIPTCHRTQFASIYEDADYINVLKYADVVAKTVYEQEAKEISKLQKSILDISSKEDPFDIFICYKENDNNGERTKDSVLAQNIYKELHREGYRIFFARITLEDKLGTQYEPYIFAALHSAKVMLHVTMSAEHSESVWVRNEWSRFLSLIAEGQQKVLIPCYKDMSAYDLPDEMQSLQGQDMSKVGAMQDLVYGIEKIFRKKTNIVEKKEIVETTIGSGSYKGLLKKGYTYLRNGRFDEADSTFDAAIKISEMPGEAYLGKVLAEYQFKTVDEVLETADEVVVDCDSFVMAKEFADEETAKLLKKIEDTLRYNRLKENYDSAMNQYNKGDIENLSLAKDNFITLEDFENSKEMVKECTYQIGVVYMSYITSIRALGYCNDATECFKEVIDYKDSKGKINQIGVLKEKITSEYKELCISKLLIAYPKTVDYVSLTEVAKKIKDNRSIVFTPNYEEFDSAKNEVEAEAIKFFISKCPAYVQSINQFNDCVRLDRLCSSIETNGNLKTVRELISQREKELKEIAAIVRKKKNKKRLKITGIVCAALAVSVATFFGIKAIVDETNRNNTYNTATSYMESGNYDDAIAYYQSLGDYKESQKKIKVCEGLKQLEASMESKKEEDAIKGIKTIVSAGEKVDVTYETENNVNIKRLITGGNSGNKTETIETIDFTLYQPMWDGYTFLNWNSNSLSYKDNRTYLGMMSNWSINSYSITYTLNGGTNDLRNPTVYNVESDTFAIYPAKRIGYTFLGWFEDENEVASIQKGTSKNFELNAHWQANNYVITLNPNSGTVDPISLDVVFDSQYTLPTPTRDYYGFDGWFDSNNREWTDGTYTTDGNVTLTAKWIPFAFTITYILNDGINDSRNPTSYTVEDSFTLLKPTRTGYSFIGWYDESNNKVTGISVGSHGDRTFTAKWKINTYIVTFKNYDGTILDTQMVDHGSSVTYGGTTPTRPATAQYTYSWTGWDKPLTNITDNTTVTATYSSTVNKYTITWKNYDGTTLKIDSVAYGETPSYTGVIPTKPTDLNFVYSFSGWSPTIAPVTGNTTYFAQFSNQQNYLYEINSGEVHITGVRDNLCLEYVVPSSIEGYPVVEICSNALNCPNATFITIPDSVTDIGLGALNGCSSLETINLPFVGASTENSTNPERCLFGRIFGQEEFNNSILCEQRRDPRDGGGWNLYEYYLPLSLKNVTVSNSNGKNNLEKEYCFANCSMIEKIVIGEGSTVIGEHAFQNCTSLLFIDFGETVRSVSALACSNCSSLIKVNFGSNFKTIKKNVFHHCTSLTNLTIPDTVIEIGYGALLGCVSLTELTIPFIGHTGEENSGSTEGSFGYIFGDYETGLGSRDTDLEASVDQNNGYTSTNFTIPYSLKKVTVTNDLNLYYGGFMCCTMLEEVILKKAIEFLPTRCFDECSSLKHISINSVSIGSMCFRNCYSLEYIVILNSEFGVGSKAFQNCSSLQCVFLPFDASDPYSYDLWRTRINGSGDTKDTGLAESMGYFYTDTTPTDPTKQCWHYVNGIPTTW